mgnify:CR=1 FL=1
MIKQILSDKEVKFNDLEKEIFEIGCKYAQNMMVNILETIDQALVKERDKKIYRHKGKRKTTIKTMMGEVEFETFGKISTNLAFKIAQHASISSFRNSASNISSTTGQSISHGGVWNVVQSLGSKLKVAVAYDGWELESKNRYKLRNKIAVAGFDNSRDFQKRKEGAIASVFNTDEVET